MRELRWRLVAALVVAAAILACRRGEEPVAEPTITLSDGWMIRSSADFASGGAEISSAPFDTTGWTATSVPTTVLAALARAGQVEDPTFGRNLEKIPAARFAVPWWYRGEFTLAVPAPAEARLVFDGINYSAEAWLNGVKIASRHELTGAFRVFELDVTPHLRPGANVLAVQVFPPAPGDFTIGFVDWNPAPPDRNLGLWREVKLRTSGGVSLDDPFVRTELDLATLDSARLTVGARLTNHTARAATARVRGRIGPDGHVEPDGKIELEERVALQPGEARDVLLTPESFPQLALRAPRLWWPNNIGEPNLYRLDLTIEVEGRTSDRREVEFGIRQFGDYLTAEGHRGYTVNGKPILIRGGGWVDDLLLADSDRRLEDQIRYVRHLNLNAIRLEGFWGTTHELYELADRHGILVWVGWSCQWEWENYLGQPVDENFGGIDTAAEIDLVTQSFRDQVIRLRNHPSVMVWNLASDMLPRPELERRYRETLTQIDPTRPPLAACSVRTSEVSGPTGVKMNGPYEWVPPDYWYLDSERGGAFGFNTETGPGAQPPVAESLRRMLPEENWWPIDEMWDYHSGRNEFASLDRYVEALEARYGKSGGLDEFARKAQVQNYEAMRPMFEAFSLRRPKTTGVVQWMLNSAWPDLFWQLYDWYLAPTGAYYAARNANRPVNVAYDYGERKVVAVNDTHAPLAGVRARVRVLDVDSKVLFDETSTLELAAEARRDVVALPPIQTRAGVFFIDARLETSDGKPLAASFYWLPTRPDVLDWAKSEWFYTPVSRFADLTALGRLPPAQLAVTHRFEPGPEGTAVVVTLSNPGPRLAFFVELAVLGKESGRFAAPILWDDNYVSLLPGETREVRGSFPAHALPANETPVFRFGGMNVR